MALPPILARVVAAQVSWHPLEEQARRHVILEGAHEHRAEVTVERGLPRDVGREDVLDPRVER